MPYADLLFYRQLAWMAKQHFDNALYYLNHILLTLAQIVVLYLVKLLNDVIHLQLNRPFSVALLIFDDIFRRFRQRLIFEHH